jgi:hypothetical protein
MRNSKSQELCVLWCDWGPILLSSAMPLSNYGGDIQVIFRLGACCAYFLAFHLSSVFSFSLCLHFSRDSAVGIATGYRLDDREVGIRVPVGSRIFTSHVVQTGSGVHPTYYTLGTWGLFPGGKAAGAWSWPLTSNWCRDEENMDLYVHSPKRLQGVVLN